MFLLQIICPRKNIFLSVFWSLLPLWHRAWEHASLPVRSVPTRRPRSEFQRSRAHRQLQAGVSSHVYHARRFPRLQKRSFRAAVSGWYKCQFETLFLRRKACIRGHRQGSKCGGDGIEDWHVRPSRSNTELKLHACVRVEGSARVCVSVCACVCTSVRAQMCACACARVCSCVCTNVRVGECVHRSKV